VLGIYSILSLCVCVCIRKTGHNSQVQRMWTPFRSTPNREIWFYLPMWWPPGICF
jgi:hypothetical protein